MFDAGLFFQRIGGDLSGLYAIYVKDTLKAGNSEYSHLKK